MNAALILPARNEMECIEAVISEARRYFAGRVIVVDNGSTDATARNASNAGADVVSAPEPGYGRACMKGVAAAGLADVLVFMDADGSDCPGDIPAMLEAMDRGADVVLAVRRGRRVESGAIAPAARFGNWLSCSLIGMFTGRRPGDLSPLKAVRRSALETIAPVEETYGWTVELLAMAAARKLVFAEVETGYRHRAGGQSKVSGTVSGSLKAGYRILAVLGRVGMRQMSSRMKGGIAGAAVGLFALLAFSAWLLSDPAAGKESLAAAWLVAWPVMLLAISGGAAVGHFVPGRTGGKR